VMSLAFVVIRDLSSRDWFAHSLVSSGSHRLAELSWAASLFSTIQFVFHNPVGFYKLCSSVGPVQTSVDWSETLLYSPLAADIEAYGIDFSLRL